MRLYAPTAGQVVLDGKRIDDLSAGALRPLRRHIQMVFQDPFVLNPRMRVRGSSPSRSAISASPGTVPTSRRSSPR